MKSKSPFIGLAALLVLVSIAWAAGTPTIDWWVIESGGGRSEAGVYTLTGVLGQPVVGAASNGSTSLCAGFGCGAEPVYYVYLPSVRNDSQ